MGARNESGRLLSVIRLPSCEGGLTGGVRAAAGTLLIALGYLMLSQVLLQLFAQFAPELMVAVQDAQTLGYGDFSLATSILAGALAPALIEEFLFRGVVMTRLRAAGVGRWFSVIVQAAAFAVLHYSVVQNTSAFLAGLIFGAAALLSGSLVPGIVAHCINNTLLSLPGITVGIASALLSVPLLPACLFGLALVVMGLWALTACRCGSDCSK